MQPTPSRAGRRHCVPPAPSPRADFDLLGSVDGTLAVVLWRAIRDVLLWAQGPPEKRLGLFPLVTPELQERYATALLEAPELAPALDIFMRLHREPEVIEDSEVAGACHAVYRYADKHS